MKNALKTSFRLTVSQVFSLGEGNLIFCCTDSQENYFGSFSQQNNNNNSKFKVEHI